MMNMVDEEEIDIIMSVLYFFSFENGWQFFHVFRVEKFNDIDLSKTGVISVNDLRLE